MKRGADGMRTFPDGSPFTILWEYSSQFATSEFVKLMTDYLKAVGLSVNAKELTSEATRDNAKAAKSDINMEWDVPYEPTLVADIRLYIPYYSDISPLFGIKWRQWYDTNGASGEEPPDWVKQMFDIAREWKTVVPGSAALHGARQGAGQAQPREHDHHRDDRRAAEAGGRRQPGCTT